jgi:hypothetical protein
MGNTPGIIHRVQDDLIKNGMKEAVGKDGLGWSPSDYWDYPHEAHHCISCSVMQSNSGGKMGKLAIASGYDINNGKNNIFLPAEFGHMRVNNEQRHRGSHDEELYYSYVHKKLNPLFDKYENSAPCPTNKAGKNIKSRLMGIQREIYKDLDAKKKWLYKWSELLYNEDYRGEGSGPLTEDNWQDSKAAGKAWVKKYKGKVKRKLRNDGKDIRVTWYTEKGYPVPVNKYK